MVVQAKAWLSWEHSVSSARTGSLQVWNGSQWHQTDFPNSGSTQLPLPLAISTASQEGGSRNVSDAASPSQPAVAAAAGGTNQAGSGDTTQQAQPAAMSAFTAQSLLECHYSHNDAFLQSPLLQVSAAEHCSFCCHCDK